MSTRSDAAYDSLHNDGVERLLADVERLNSEVTVFETKDSGAREEYASGMVRDTVAGKPRYDLIALAPLKRLAELYARGAEKYGDRNWQLANSPEEMQRFRGSAFRHFVQWLNGEVDEDHAIAAVWNIFAVIQLETEQQCSAS